jgi:hypothetical protein
VISAVPLMRAMAFDHVYWGNYSQRKHMSTPNNHIPTGRPRAGPPPDPAHLEPTGLERVEKEHAIRAAATVAAKSQGLPLAPGALDFIVASSDLRQDTRALETRAASIANYVVNDVKAPNFSGATREQVATYLASIGRQFGDYRKMASIAGGGGHDDGGGEAPASSARYGPAFWGSPKGQEQMAAYARDRGVGWLANNPEVLRLGPAAIETFAKAQLTGEEGKKRYDGLRSVGFSARDAFNAAKWAADNGKDGKEVFKSTEDSVRMFGGNDPAEQKRWRDLFNNFYAKPEDAEARQGLTDALRQKKASGTADEKKQADDTLQKLELEKATRNDANAEVAKTAAKEAGADVKVAQKNSELDAFNKPDANAPVKAQSKPEQDTKAGDQNPQRPQQPVRQAASSAPKPSG